LECAIIKAMSQLVREAWVPYTPEQMYNLVNDVEKYPQFLPWCRLTEVLYAKEDEIMAKIHIAKGGIHKSFTTLNRLQKNRRVAMDLIEGPFNHLQGGWDFEPVSEVGGCQISFKLEFEFSSKLLNVTLGPLFQQITNKMVSAFTERAQQVYG